MATLALNHKIRIPSSLDLSKADWEFYNQYSVTDFDNKNVPNIVNILPSINDEFLISQINDCIIIASGEDAKLADGLDISTIKDGVQYRVDPTKRHTLDSRIDKTTIKSTSPYGGQSMQRREPGYDTNNGNLDWMIVGAPTPGWQ
ncbi:MAG TPA: DUF4876 domain-containing protein [Ignavibacteriales bacterium]|nr:DUF4876 domain-containing protein [Ignavibacteriales bacterium]